MSFPVRKYDPSAGALRPLMQTFWSASGWRRPPAWPDPEMMRGAAGAGVMFASPRTQDHDGWVHAARAWHLISSNSPGRPG